MSKMTMSKRLLCAPIILLLLQLVDDSHAFTSFAGLVPSIQAPRRSNHRWSPLPECSGLTSGSSSTKLSAYKSAFPTEEPWIPVTNREEGRRLEQASVDYLAALISRLAPLDGSDPGIRVEGDLSAYEIAKPHFIDLSCTLHGEIQFQNLFKLGTPSQVIPGSLDANLPESTNVPLVEEDVVMGAVLALQSLAVMGMQVGVKGPPRTQKGRLSHLWEGAEDTNPIGASYQVNSYIWKQWEDNKSGYRQHNSNDTYNHSTVARRLKFDRNERGGMAVLKKLSRKQNPRGAFELLVALGVWNVHEDVVLLRSGFPTRFSEVDDLAASEAMSSTYDPDTLLKIRKDFRMMKVYTIDSSSTSEIDDGISIQAFTDPSTGDLRKRYWIHIADADRWAPRNSRILEAAKQRSTSIYLPNRSYSMFPFKLASGVMSLKHTVDTCALSLGVEVDPVDGSIVEDSIVMTPSLVRVSYRLTYDQVDEMLEEGVGYNEEWELGSMLSVASKRRQVRIEKSSIDRLLSVKIPQVTPRVVFRDESESPSREQNDENDDNVAISLNIEVPNNAGRNSTSGAEEATATAFAGNGVVSSKIQEGIPDVSPANLLVTEMMIMANEALGRWGVMRLTESKEEKEGGFIDLPYRSQAAPLFSERPTEYEHFMKLQSEMVGGGYCAAWYMRRFSTPVSVSSEPMPHAAMGLDCYVQWTSPIRRYSDLQVQAVVKRFLRRKQVLKLLRDGQPVPSQISATDLGGLGKELRLARNNSNGDEGRLEDDTLFTDMAPINYKDGTGLIKAARFVQNGSNEYWMLEYIKRLKQKATDDIEFECMVLGCFNEEKQLYSVFIHEIAFEYKYRSEKGQLNPGDTIWLTPMDINPRMGLMTLTLSARSRGLKQAVSKSTETARAA